MFSYILQLIIPRHTMSMAGVQLRRQCLVSGYGKRCRHWTNTIMHFSWYAWPSV